ncbi:MAG TPA: UPF0182 family protein [Terriglobales bacterium]|nr:UPF0182 family protein [Terriglobales bacterium]
MQAILFAIAVVLVVLFAQWRKRRLRGRFEPATVARAIGVAIAALYILIEGSRFWIDFAWWKELGQAATFWQFLRIRWLPQTVMAILAMLILLLAFSIGRRRCASPLARTSLFTWVGRLLSAALGIFISVNIIDPWVVALFWGARNVGAYTDPIYHKSLDFYFFRLPFFEMIFDWAAALAIASLAVMAITIALGSSAERLQEMRQRMMAQMEGRGYTPVAMPVSRQSRISLQASLRTAAVLLLILFAIAEFFARYGLLFSSHRFLTGADFVDVRFGIPLLWTQIVGALLLALLVIVARRGAGRSLTRTSGMYSDRGRALGAFREQSENWLPANAPTWLAPVVIVVFVVLALGPALLQALVRNVYVSPNELTLERPYIADHIKATRMAFNLEQTAHEEAFSPRATDTLDLSQYPDTANNIRLWDSTPFQDNVTQLQALRPYYAFPNVDVDRYQIQGTKRQVLIAARGLDTSLLPTTAQSWVNLSLQYTHGYGAVAAMVNSATTEGQPELILKNAPPTGPYSDFQITRPGMYFGEETTRPVFVDTKQDEFDYPRGDDNSYTKYNGAAGIVLSSPMLRLAAAIDQDDTNVLLTGYFTERTRLLLHRQIVERVQTLAPFLTLDPDPYLVIDSQGHPYWILDAYTTSDQHPYAQPVSIGDDDVNYIRNSVKVTVDAYNGTVRLYAFDDEDPILRAYRDVFPELFVERTQMPADLLAHIRYPQLLFEAQAETYRLYHMQDPQVFYNKEDQWDIAKQVVTQEESRPTAPYYVMLRLPGDTQAEFVLMVPFTSHSRDNLISWLAARCDPAHYGQIIFYRLPKEQLIYGPLQIESRVDQDRDISKDLSLWNQQGSRVIRGTTLVLPVAGTFLYVEPIYIQATQAKLPELKKVVLAVGNRLVYADDLPTAMRELAQPPTGTSIAPPASAASGVVNAAVAHAAAGVSREVLASIQGHLDRYRALTAQGQFAQAGQELQAAQDELSRALAGH